MDTKLVIKNECEYNQQKLVDYLLEEDLETLSNFLDFDLVENPRTIDEDDIFDRLEELSEDEILKWWNIYLRDSELKIEPITALEADIRDVLSLSISDDYINLVLSNLMEEIKDDIICASNYNNGSYSTDDIRLAFGRVLEDLLQQ